METNQIAAKRGDKRLAARLFDPRNPFFRKTLRYSAVSAISVVISQALLIFFNGLLGWSGAASNAAAVCLAAGPAYLLNRYWVWNKRGRNHLWKEVVPFWAVALLGLAFSTWLVALADEIWGTTLAVSAANLSAFASLWVGKFLLLNHVLFAAVPPERRSSE